MSLPSLSSTARAGTPFLIHPTNVDVNQQEVGLEKRLVGVVVEIKVEHTAVRTPIAAEVDDDASMRCGGAPQRGGEIVLGLFWAGVYIARSREVRRLQHDRQECDG
jgi:hypothetical protein